MSMRRRFFALLLALALQASAWPAELVYINTPQGAERLVAASHRSQFFAIQPYVESQDNLAFCGPASMAAILNSLDIPRPPVPRLQPYGFFTQDNLFTARTEAIKTRAAVSARGMTLAQVAGFLEALGVRATVRYGDGLDLKNLRALLAAALEAPGTRVLANYSRPALGQAGGGHISPLAAYDEATDSVLLLDVAKFKYPPTWVPLPDLLGAMGTTDPESGRSRGLVIVERR